MKKILLFTLVFSFGLFTMAQKEIKSFKANFNQKIGIEPVKETPMVTALPVDQPAQNADRDTDIVTIIDIGTSANAYSYGYQGGQKQIVAYQPDLNVLTHFHRMGGALDPTGYSGDLGYDISFDGGMTWENMVECYVATENAGGEYFTDAARYPNHGLWDSDGTVEGAYVVYFAPNLDGSNSTDSWGGYSYGIINTADTSIRTKNLQSSEGDVYQYIPDGYTLTSQGLSLAVDINQDWSSGSLDYQDEIILNKGIYDEGEEDFVYEQEFFEMIIINEEEQFRPSFSQTAFSKDGMTGYLVILADDGSNEHIGDTYGQYPIYWKTTDGGENWTGPDFVQLDGPNGLGGIVYHLVDDETYVEFFEDTPREELGYTTGFDFDCAVDHNGNLHIAVAIGPTASSNYSISSNEGLFGIMDIYTTDGGTSWYAEIMGHPQCFRGEYPNDTYTEDNRVQITTNADHNRLFISWLDTDIEDEDNNNRPNIYARGFNPSTLMKTVDAEGADAPFNVTFLSTAWRAAHFAIAANYSIDDNGTYTIPYTYMEMNVEDPVQPVQYKYIQDFSFSEADFTIQSVNENIASSDLFKVSQNYPNPVMGDTYFTVSLDEGSQLNLEVFSLTGQLVSTTDLGYKSAGTHTLTINANDLSAGVYFYTVSAGVNKVTHKMIVQ